jgi:hypothetical protein
LIKKIHFYSLQVHVRLKAAEIFAAIKEAPIAHHGNDLPAKK